MSASLKFIVKLLLTLIPLRYFTESVVNWVFDDLIKTGEEGAKIAKWFVDNAMEARKAFKIKKMVNPKVIDEK